MTTAPQTTEADALVEAVARKLAADVGYNPDEPCLHPAQKSWEQPSWRKWQEWEHTARVAAAAALRTLAEQHRSDISGDAMGFGHWLDGFAADVENGDV